MRPTISDLCIVLTVLSTASASRAQTPASFRVLVGVTDSTSSRWDGTITVTGAGHYALEGWRFEGADQIDGNLFYMSTHQARLAMPIDVLPQEGSIVANGLIITVDAINVSSEIAFSTAQGDFRFRAAEVPYRGGIYKLGGRVYVDRVPAAVRLTDTKEEEDYPSIASGSNGDIWLAYVQFVHNPDHGKLRAELHEDPKSYGPYKAPTGGDQVWARKYSGGHWGEPVPVVKPGHDIYRTAVAVDGSGVAWVFCSANHRGNFEIYARPIDNAGPKEQVRVTNEAGSDIDPVAATDATGKVWVAWQGWRDGVAAIFAAHQDGRGFSAPVKVSNSDKNEWNPAIAADKSGHVAIAWDSYRRGNYDIYARIWTSSSWGAEVPIAASARYEAYPSIAYDPSGRLWIAYEEGGRSWGKDFGALSTTGVALYQGRLVRLRGLEPDGRLITLDSSLVGVPGFRADRTASQSDSESLDPNPGIALHRQGDLFGWSGHRSYYRAAKNTLPRLAIDGSGRIWLAFRTAHPIWWSPTIGPVWTEYLASFDGREWNKPIFLNHTDNLLDNRPALLPTNNGRLLIVNSSDGRRTAPADSINNDLWSQEVDLGPANGMIPRVAVGAGARPEPLAVDGADAAGIKTIREYRGGPEGDLRIVRGEFHRHSEISSDGENDGSLLDQWRYILDAAALDWVGCCDHDNGNGREYSWWMIQKLTDVFHTPGKFIPMFSYERSVNYPEGHRNVIFAERGVRPLPRLPISDAGRPDHAPDTQMLYAYLRQFNGITAVHTSATFMGTDWRDNDRNSEPVVEIYQGDRQNYEMPGAPRSNSAQDSLGGWRPKGYVSVALDKGYRLGFEASSDHISTHISYANLYVKDVTREAVLEALKSRHIYAATDDILADVESGSHLMGDEFSTSELPALRIKLKGTSKFAKVSIIRDGKYVYSSSPNTQEVELSWRDNQPNKEKTSYYYVRAEQDNGELVWASPLWIRYTGN